MASALVEGCVRGTDPNRTDTDGDEFDDPFELQGRKVDAPLPPGEGLPAILCDPEVAEEVQEFADERSQEAVRRRQLAKQDELLGWSDFEPTPPGLIKDAERKVIQAALEEAAQE